MREQMSCPSCFAPLEIQHRFVKLVTCDFCNQVSILRDSGLDPTGKKAKLAQMPSRFFVDAEGKIGGREFRVLGRLRYQYDAGFWDEWFISFTDEEPGWLVEDEGTYKYYRKVTITEKLPAYHEIKVGSEIRVNGRKMFVVEKGEARIAGGEGQLAFEIVPGEKLYYVDGTNGENLMSIEFYEDEIEVSLGRPVDEDVIEVFEDDF
ncbi:MAG TPA: DUF4178 domain-containing protein [Anaerolineae bacterium]|nr:DUF4178 domain-containing protein [Anaerolineae bacterium]